MAMQSLPGKKGCSSVSVCCEEAAARISNRLYTVRRVVPCPLELGSNSIRIGKVLVRAEVSKEVIQVRPRGRLPCYKVAKLDRVKMASESGAICQVTYISKLAQSMM